MPDAFSQFDLVMMDLECIPDGRMNQGRTLRGRCGRRLKTGPSAPVEN
jgi:hypothetical protein